MWGRGWCKTYGDSSNDDDRAAHLVYQAIGGERATRVEVEIQGTGATLRGCTREVQAALGRFMAVEELEELDGVLDESLGVDAHVGVLRRRMEGDR